MNHFRTITDVIFVSFFAVTLLFFTTPARAQSGEMEQAITEVQKETQVENMDYLSLEDEFLQTSTDDIKQQQKEQWEEAQLAKQEEQAAFVKLKKSKKTKVKVEAVASKKIARDREIQIEAKRNRDHYMVKAQEVEREIARLEKRIAKTEALTKTILEETKRAKENYRELKKKRDYLRNMDEKAQYEKRRAERDAVRKVAKTN